MKNAINITGLDVGSSKIAAVMARVDEDGSIDVLAHVTGDAFGISRGMLANLDDSIDSVSKVLTKLKRKASRNLSDIYVNICAQDLRGEKSYGMTPISLRGREVVKSDIDKCIDAASTIHLPFDREVIHKVVHSFSIDDQPWIKNPLGLYASRLACQTYVVTANINHIQSIYKCVNDAGFDIKEIAFSGIAAGMVLVDKEAKENGAVLVDIGNSLTGISVFAGGVLDNLEVLGFGSRDAGDDFRASALFDGAITSISARIADLKARTMKDPAVIVAGGYALTDGVIEFMEEKLSRPLKLGSLRGVRGDISGLDNIRLATAIGLSAWANDKRLSREKNGSKRLSSKIVELFNSYF